MMMFTTFVSVMMSPTRATFIRTRYLPPHPLPNSLSLLSRVLDLVLQVRDLLLQPPLLIRYIIHLPLNEETLVTHQDLLVHKHAPGRRI